MELEGGGQSQNGDSKNGDTLEQSQKGDNKSKTATSNTCQFIMENHIISLHTMCKVTKVQVTGY